MNRSEGAPPGPPIAIIGMSGRFPGAATLDRFWHNLRNGVEGVRFFSDEELLEAGVSAATLRDPRYVKARGVLDNVSMFDAGFFGFTPREAEITDPQQRVFLECAWNALEDAGYCPGTFKGNIGVFAGVSWSTYLFDLYERPDVWASMGGFQIAIGNEKDHLTTRVAYKLNLHGPCVTVQTACSSSLVAVCMACDSLTSGSSDLVIAGGASISVPQIAGYLFHEGGILSPDGHCRTFDAGARGTVGGNGIGVIALKRLTDAIADRDRICAVIKGWAVNNDGATKVGYTAPSIVGQAEVIAAAHKRAGVGAETISYVEAHGTGTPLGDPIEIAALTAAFQRQTARSGFCGLGSVKSNIGHLDAAAGAAGLIKTTLALQHREIPPTLHYDRPNPVIPFAGSPFYVNAQLTAWPSAGTPRRAGVSSFGIGGTNAHVIVEEAPASTPDEDVEREHLLPLSARTTTALESATGNLADHLATAPIRLADAAYTLQVGRASFSCRRFAVCSSTADAFAVLRGADPQRMTSAKDTPRARSVAWLFPGQGSQYAGMTAGLYRSEQVFRAAVDSLLDTVDGSSAGTLGRLLRSSEAASGASMSEIDQTVHAQPALFIAEYALAQLLIAWGFHPAALMGHSVGEFTAACLAGVFTPTDALALVAERGRMMQALPTGRMLAVPMSAEGIRPLLGDTMDIAAINRPDVTVISGAAEDIAALEKSLAVRSIACRSLATSHAFHSPSMDPIVREFVARVAAVRRHPPRIPIVSNLTGTWMNDEQAMDPGYWGSHVRRTVRFSDGLKELLREEDRLVLEVGPGRTLTSLAAGHPDRTAGHVVISCGRHAHDATSDRATLLKAVGRLWLAGVAVDWSALWKDERRGRVALPTYPFERQHHWIDRASVTRAPEPARPVHSDRASDIADLFYVPTWTRRPLGPATVDAPDPKRWLIFADGQGYARSLASRLASLAHECTLVWPGSAFDRIGDGEYGLPADDRRSYAMLFEELQRKRWTADAVVHFWNVAPTSDDEDFRIRFSREQRRGASSLILLGALLPGVSSGAALPVTVVGSHLFDVHGNEELCPERASVVGACRAIPQERPGLSCRVIDIGPAQFDPSLDERLWQELTTGSSDVVVSLRAHHRWVQTFERWPLPAADASRSLLRRGGCYLITGGRGRLGFVIARFLADKAQANLVLMGRSVLPAREDSERYLARSGDDGLSFELRRILALERLGSKVLPVSADVSDGDAVRRGIALARDRFGRIDGVFHAAGLTETHGFKPLEDTDVALCDAHNAPKIFGLDVLHQALEADPPDFWVLASSLSAVLGGLGMTAYAAANAALDAYATAQRPRGRSEWITVNWDGWDFRTAEDRAAHANGPPSITVEEGVQALDRVLVHGNPVQLVVSATDLHPRLKQWVATSTDAREASLRAGGSPRSPVTAVDEIAQAEASADDIQALMIELWRDLLGISRIESQSDFFDLGGHSLLAIQLISRVRNLFGVELSVHRVFEQPTIAGLSELVRAQRQTDATARLETMLAMVEGLTDEQIRGLLAAQDGLPPAAISEA